MKESLLGFLSISALFVLTSTSASLAHTTSFRAGEWSWQLGTIAVADVDDDPQMEIFVPYRRSDQTWVLDGYDHSGQRLDGYPFIAGKSPINVSPTITDVDGDYSLELIITQGNKITVLRARDGAVVWSEAVSHENYIPNAGFQVVTNGFYWSWGGGWRSHLPSSAVFASEVSPPLVADIDNDGKMEILTAWKIDPDTDSTAQDYNPFIAGLFGFTDWGAVGDTWSGGVMVHDAATGRQKLIYHFNQLVESGLGIGQADEDPALEVFVLNDSDSVAAFDITKPYGLYGNDMLHGMFGKNQRLLSGSYLQGVDVYPADIDGDGCDELLVPTTRWHPLWQPSETILDNNGAIMWRDWKEAADFQNYNGWLNSACMIPVNPDQDNHIDVLTFAHSHEISYRYWDGVQLVDHPGWPKNFAPELPTPPLMGDLDGDGKEEIVIGTYNPSAFPSGGSLFVYDLNGTLKFSEQVPGGVKHIPTLADVDADGRIDIIYRSLDGTIYIRHLADAIQNNVKVSWGTHRGNVRRDGNLGISLYPRGTPRIVKKTGEYKRISFEWTLPDQTVPEFFRIRRAIRGNGPFETVASLGPANRSFVDEAVSVGWQYFYEVEAVYGSNSVRSAPFAVTSTYDGNLVVNSGFEEDDDSNWDKWFTGDIPWRNMAGSQDNPHRGRQSMRVRLEGHSDNSSISQYRQYGIVDAYIPVKPGTLYSFGGFIKSTGISSPSEHWLEWNSAGTGENTTPRPPLPWPDYFTPALKIGPAPVDWTYLNRVFVMPEGFPNLEIRHRFSIDEPGSGAVFLDDIFVRALPSLESSEWNALIPMGANWKYQTDVMRSLWTAPEYNDSQWPEGQAKFGAGKIPTNVVTQLPPFRSRYYFRHHFNVPSELSELLLAATATDNFESQIYPLQIYLNGFEIKSSGIEAVSGEGNKKIYYDLTPFVELLRTGKNTMAVLVNNAWGQSWDSVAFDLSLLGIPLKRSARDVQFQTIRRANNSVDLQINGTPGTLWQLEESDALNDQSHWISLRDELLPASGTVTINQPAASSTGARFFRLVPK